jgi:hypothetical protein
VGCFANGETRLETTTTTTTTRTVTTRGGRWQQAQPQVGRRKVDAAGKAAGKQGNVHWMSLSLFVVDLI